MYVVILQGNLGEGKTTAVSVLAHYFKAQAVKQGLNIGLFSNYGLKFSEPLEHYEDFYKLAKYTDGCIAVYDEGQTLVDSRMFSSKANIFLTQFAMYLRKLGGGTTFMLTTPNLNNIDLRVRQITNILIDCHKESNRFEYDFYDYQGQKFLKSLVLPFDKAQEIFKVGLFDTEKMLIPFQFPNKEEEFSLFLKRLIMIQNETRKNLRLKQIQL